MNCIIRIKNKALLISSVAIVLALVSCRNKQEDYDATGSFEATEIIVSAQATGAILQLNVQEGQALQKGEVVGVIDSTQLHLQKMSLMSSAKGVRTQQPDVHKQTAALQGQIKTLEREKDRINRLIEANAANRKQLDDIEAQIGVLQSQLTATTSTLQKNIVSITSQSSAIDIQIAQLEDQLEKTSIKSPVSGTVLNKYAEAGELATMGTPLFKVAETQNMHLRAYVTNDQLAQIKLNDEVTVRVDEGNGKMRSYSGKVNWISDKSEFTPKAIQTKNERANLVYAIKIAVPNDGYIKIGMYGEVIFR